MVKLEELLGDMYADFEVVNSIEKMSYELGTEHWEQNFKSLLSLVYCKRVGGKGTTIVWHALINFSLSPYLGTARVEEQRDGKFWKW